MKKLATTCLLVSTLLVLPGCPGDDDDPPADATDSTAETSDTVETVDTTDADAVLQDGVLDDTGPAANPCKQCNTDADCQGGMTCQDDDNNALTPTVCTRLFTPATGCPSGMYGDLAISKYCICQDCGSVFNPQCLPWDCPLGTGDASELGKCKIEGDKCTCAKLEEVETNPCKPCTNDADCEGGLVCFDEDANPGTPKVCTKPYDPAIGCPPGMFGDYAISKYCICDDCGAEFNPLCEDKVCLLPPTSKSTGLGKCKKLADGSCDCAPEEQVTNPCKQCNTDADCQGGLICQDDDNNTLTATVCTMLYVPANGCPVGMHGDFAISKYCICEDCGSVYNPQCLPNDCPIGTGAASTLGKCKIDASGSCTCLPNEPPAANPCKKCQTDADCLGGLVCRDDDNTSLTPTVCTLPYVPSEGCPAGTFGDFAISKYCICKDCGGDLNPMCQPDPCVQGTGASAVLGNCKPDDNTGVCVCKS